MEETNHNEEAILSLEGEIDLENSYILKEKVLQAFYEKHCANITLDFSLLTSIDSSGLGQLLLCQKTLKRCGGKLKIINVTSRYIREMFKMIQLDRIITIKFDSVPQ